MSAPSERGRRLQDQPVFFKLEVRDLIRPDSVGKGGPLHVVGGRARALLNAEGPVSYPPHRTSFNFKWGSLSPLR